jgi:uncharacterized protein (DUF58 family)
MLLAAVLMRRVDLVLLAVPIVVGAAIGLASRPRRTPTVRLSVPRAAALEGGELAPTVTVEAPDPVDLVTVELLLPRWLTADDAPLARAVAPLSAEPTELAFRVRSQRWGRRTLGPAVITGTAGYGLLRCGPYPSLPGLVTVWPLPAGFDAVDTVPRAEGLVGPHLSRRLGPGSDIAGVRPFAPGDRLRRVNWRVSQRTDRLHVTSTYSDLDAEVVLCLDSRHDLGEPPASSLDVAVRAAAAIAEHYLRHGDRVGLLDLGRADRRVRAGNGQAHLIALLDLLLDVRELGRQATSERYQGRLATELPRLLPRRALVIALTPLAGEAIFELLGTLGRRGAAVVVVDTLPATARPAENSRWTSLAFRLWRLERDAGIDRLAGLGVPVVPWVGPGSLDAVLRDVSQAARAPRVAR